MPTPVAGDKRRRDDGESDDEPDEPSEPPPDDDDDPPPPDDDDDDPPPADARPGCCWLCENSGSQHTRAFHAFVVKNAHSVDALAMSRYFCDLLAEECPDDPARPGVDEVHAHILRHVLHPTVRVAHILRNLLELAETLREVVVSRADDGSPLIDVRTVTVYLKVVAEIMQVYKTSDTNRMLFADAMQQ